ncbi:DUF1993 family protein [Aestuariivirga sp. YIM B02566]|uniref:DUF1993 domain-containing protein n=1 Tax=Taklimakanibacter albus TaxID=2800327 RepID=A0ACC5QZL3_9HYPH|nr:DUF1993 domain-containing protein [Aestuariivirga sp. YIM B02566]MBK1865841.1 DUF1993 domain-containing protein [Aestuariivirga sp. YIM B02566]
MIQINRDGAFHRLTIIPMMAALDNLGGILDKAEAHVTAAKTDPVPLLEARLHPDMFSLIQQLQYALFIPVEFARHFHDGEPPKVGYEEANLADVRAGMKLAQAYLGGVAPERMDAQADLIVPVFFDARQGLTTEDYASRIIMPDFYFHVTVAYAILRHAGVPLGKRDFLGKLRTTRLT